MNDIDLLKHAAINNPDETTPLAMLADEWLSRGDVRGEILKHYIEGKGNLGPYAPVDTADQQHEDGYTLFRKGYGNDSPHITTVFRVVGRHGGRKHSDHYTVAVSHADARSIADHMPDPTKFHQFLDTHFGPDPRTEKFAKVYSRALKKTT